MILKFYCAKIQIFSLPLYRPKGQSFRKYKKVPYTRKIANFQEVYTRYREQLTYSELLVCAYIQVFGDTYEYAWTAAHFSL